MSPVIRRCLKGLSMDFDLVHTSEAGEAIALAGQAVDDGFDTIVAVGGDGTSHEVINGMMSRANGGPMGTFATIPAGSGNDFAAMNGMPSDIESACNMIAEGRARVIDLGRVTIDGVITRYFDNTIGIGFDGLVVKETQKFRWLRGMLLYLVVVLKTIFLTMRPSRSEITCDGRTFRATPLMVVISNGPREGGSFMVAPDARYDDGVFDLIIAETMSRLEMLTMIPRFMKGTHLSHRRIEAIRAGHIVIQSQDPLHIHVDGEILCEEAHHVEVQIVPGTLSVIGAETVAIALN
jgi:YegS/Rv2252/BmrU family lipid kinase